MKLTLTSYKMNSDGKYVFFHTSHGYYESELDYLSYLKRQYPNDSFRVVQGERSGQSNAVRGSVPNPNVSYTGVNIPNPNVTYTGVKDSLLSFITEKNKYYVYGGAALLLILLIPAIKKALK